VSPLLGIRGAGLRASAERGAAGLLRLATPADPHTLLPILQTTSEEGYLAGLVFDTLVDYDGANQPRPELAREVPRRRNGGNSTDGKTYRAFPSICSRGAPDRRPIYSMPTRCRPHQPPVRDTRLDVREGARR
jgi:hypothetical protein